MNDITAASRPSSGHFFPLGRTSVSVRRLYQNPDVTLFLRLGTRLGGAAEVFVVVTFDGSDLTSCVSIFFSSRRCTPRTRLGTLGSARCETGTGCMLCTGRNFSWERLRSV